jgi:uncharacterized coiled-coil protein SlyX
MEMLSESGSSSRIRRKKDRAANMETQVAELQRTAAKEMEQVDKLWEKISEMQKQGRTS